MQDVMSRLIEKYRWLILYGLFGIGTVVVNMVVYAFGARYMLWSTIVSNSLAWILSVLFSYVTNHKWVFDNAKHDLNGIIKECISFISCRLMTGLVDIFMMIVLVDGLQMYDMSAKVIVNILVIILNLFACKHIIFKPSDSNIVEELELSDNKFFN